MSNPYGGDPSQQPNDPYAPTQFGTPVTPPSSNPAGGPDLNKRATPTPPATPGSESAPGQGSVPGYGSTPAPAPGPAPGAGSTPGYGAAPNYGTGGLPGYGSVPGQIPDSGGWSAAGSAGGFPPPSAQPVYGTPSYGAGSYGAGSYGAGSYGPGGGYPLVTPPKTNGMAIGSLIASCVGMALCCFGIPSIVGIVLGVLARKQIAESNGTETGDGMALAGLILGVVALIPGIVFWVLYFAGAVAQSI
ncbi:MAG: DUF4190 domain-containing protein [Gordonia sp. (in: high G+C Gram-positive bacteria)]